MYQINLIKKSLFRTDYLYTIRTKNDNDFFYFYDFSDIDDYVIIWTQILSKSMKFETEREVEEFKYNFFKGRKCEIVRFKNIIS